MADQPRSPNEDLDAFASELEQEIIKDPPLRCSISLHWNGTQDDADRVHFELVVQSALLRHESPWLDFSALKSIVFHIDYEQGLRDASVRSGRDLIPTREPAGLSLAMLVHATDTCELIADASLALGLLSEESSKRDVCVSTLRHELCHVDDFQRKSLLWKGEWLKARLEGVRATFFPIADALWSEYYANRVSDSPLADGYLASEEDMLGAAIRDAARDIEQAIVLFRLSRDMGALAPLASRKVSFVAMSMGYVLGRYAARGVSTPRSDALQDALRASHLEDTFEASRRALDRLFEDRTAWTSTQDLAELERIWFRVMCGFGLRFEEVSPNKVYIHVPLSKSP